MTLLLLDKVYTSASNMFSMAQKFNQVSRNGPKVHFTCLNVFERSSVHMNNLQFWCFQAFVSEYCVTGKDAGKGSLLAALAEAAFLLGLEKNRSL